MRSDRAVSVLQRLASLPTSIGTRHGCASMLTRSAVDRPSGALHSATSSPLAARPSAIVAILGCMAVS